MTVTVKGNLTMIGLNTDTPQVFWNGKAITGLLGVKVEWEKGERQIKLRVNGADDALYMELVSAGINIKKGK